MKEELNGFKAFLKEQNVVATAIGFVVGAGAGTLVKSLVDSLISPLIGLVTGLFSGAAGNLSEMSFTVRGSVFAWGSFVANLINFLIVCFVVYFIVKKVIVFLEHKPKTSIEMP